MILDALRSAVLRYWCVTEGLSGLFSALGAALLLAVKGSGRSVCVALCKGSRQIPTCCSHRCTTWSISLGLCVCTTMLKLLQLDNWLILWRKPSWCFLWKKSDTPCLLKTISVSGGMTVLWYWYYICTWSIAWVAVTDVKNNKVMNSLKYCFCW